MHVRTIVFLGCFCAGASTALAQIAVPRLETGGSAGAIVGGGGSDWFMILSFGPRLTFNATQRDAVEIVAELVGPVERDGLNGLYLVQYKRALRAHGLRRSQLFLSAGLGGSFSYYRSTEYRSERPDGSVFVQPAHTHASLQRPFLGAVGLGVERIVARYAAVRGELQVVVVQLAAVGARGTVGVTVPIGGYRGR